MYRTTIIVAAVLSACVSLSPAARAATLVARYEFEDDGNLGADSSGMANHATIVTNVTQVEGRTFGSQGAFFDEAAASFFMIESLDGFDGLTGFSYTAWVKLAANTGGFDGIISQDNGACCESRLLLHPAHTPYVNIHKHADVHYSGAPPVQLETWTHIALTAEDLGGSTAGHIYINGEEVPGSPASFDALGTSAPFMTYLGAGEAGTAHRLTGTLDDVRIYDGTLTQAEVQTIMNESLIPEPNTLLLATLGLLGLVARRWRRRGA